MVHDADDCHRSYKVGYWFSEKKCQRFGASELTEECKKKNIKFVKIDLSASIEEQGPFDMILHKFTALYSLSVMGDLKAQAAVEKVEDYIRKFPKVIMLDTVENVKKLLYRDQSYDLLNKITEAEGSIFTPPFATILEKNSKCNQMAITDKNVTFPIVCKPLDAGGGTFAHEMAVVFSEERLSDFPTPYVAETFVRHGAVLYKIFILGDRWYVTLRPSLKNFCDKDRPTIHFNSHHVSKSDSCSPLSCPDEKDSSKSPKADFNIFQRIVDIVKDSLDCEFLGIDVVIDVETERYAIIDLNPFPSYDAIPNVMSHIAETLRSRLNEGDRRKNPCRLWLTTNVDRKYFHDALPKDAFIKT